MLKNIMNKINQKNKKKKKGFTLIELIIVIAIIAILAAIALPKFMDVREKANVKSDIGNAKNIQLAVATLVADESYSTLPIDFELASTDTDAATAIAKLQNIETVKAKPNKGQSFFVAIDASGEITVRVASDTGTIVYPNASSTPYKN